MSAAKFPLSYNISTLPILDHLIEIIFPILRADLSILSYKTSQDFISMPSDMTTSPPSFFAVHFGHFGHFGPFGPFGQGVQLPCGRQVSLLTCQARFSRLSI